MATTARGHRKALFRRLQLTQATGNVFLEINIDRIGERMSFVQNTFGSAWSDWKTCSHQLHLKQQFWSRFFFFLVPKISIAFPVFEKQLLFHNLRPWSINSTTICQSPHTNTKCLDGPELPTRTQSLGGATFHTNTYSSVFLCNIILNWFLCVIQLNKALQWLCQCYRVTGVQQMGREGGARGLYL